MPGLPVHHQLTAFTQTHVHSVGDAIQPSHPLSSLLLLPSILPSIRVFSSQLALHIRWSKCWSFSFNISPSNEYSGLISFRMDWLNLFVVQGTLKRLFQPHSSKASILQCSASLQSNSHIHTGLLEKPVLTRWTVVSKQYLSFFICCLGWSQLLSQGASVF